MQINPSGALSLRDGDTSPIERGAGADSTGAAHIRWGQSLIPGNYFRVFGVTPLGMVVC